MEDVEWIGYGDLPSQLWERLKEHLDEKGTAAQSLPPNSCWALVLDGNSRTQRGKHSLLKTVVQVLPPRQHREVFDDVAVVRLHPLLAQFFCEVSAVVKLDNEKDLESNVIVEPFLSTSISPGINETSPRFWPQLVSAVPMPELAEICVEILYTECVESGRSLTPLDGKEYRAPDWNDAIANAIQCRVIQEGCVIAVSVAIQMALFSETMSSVSPRGLSRVVCMLIRVRTVQLLRDETFCDGRIAETGTTFYVSPDSTYTVTVQWDDVTDPAHTIDSHETASMNASLLCPGYERLVDQVISLLQLPFTIRPSGILLTGVSGVGKSHLAKAIAALWQDSCRHSSPGLSRPLAATGSANVVRWISAADLLLSSSSSDFESLVEDLLTSPPLLIIDDLHVLNRARDEEGSMDAERQFIRNALTTAFDRINCGESRSMLLGIAQDSSLLPAELVKISRFEKEVCMLPPSQQQREALLCQLLAEVGGVGQETAAMWSRLAAPLLAGCVAADLRRVCIAARTSAQARSEAAADQEIGADTLSTETGFSFVMTWEDFREASRDCVPSQLSSLDVSKPMLFNTDNFDGSVESRLRVHELSWSRFAGYHEVKKRIYRNFVSPWRRWLSDTDVLDEHKLIPPAGILFFGPAGTGKTMAARCLASSLGLSMINIQAATVLDKWLGGSEQMIRAIFARARSAAPVVLFFDEIDALASNRASDGGSVDVMSRVLSTFLNEMDGISNSRSSNVIVVACTNRRQSLDSALLRPGRLEEHVLLDVPTAIDIELILEQRLGRIQVDNSVSLSSLAKNLFAHRLASSDVVGICRESVLVAVKRASSSADVCLSLADFRIASQILRIQGCL
jgi:SpoVK/Ycf46/Vps4 family AAA+-type ATPase